MKKKMKAVIADEMTVEDIQKLWDKIIYDEKLEDELDERYEYYGTDTVIKN